jgi:type I restriction enzyme M protein
MPEVGYYTTKELANILGVTRQAIFKKIKTGEIPAISRGRDYLIPKEKLPEEIKKLIEEKQKIETKRILELSTNSFKDIDFEKELWKAADKLRGSLDPSDYKYIVLGLIFLKYVSDAFYQRRELLKEWVSDSNNKEFFVPDENARQFIIEDKDQYKSAGVFYIPEKARWEYLQKFSLIPDIGKKIDEAMEEIEKENPVLKDILPKIYAQTNLEPHVLSDLINIFSKIRFDHKTYEDKDVLGRVYEYFLGQFASSEGKRGGQFFTPRPIVKLLVEILEPFEGCRVFDPACGSGGMFIQSAKFLEIHKKDPSKISFYGQELNVNTWRLCMMNLAIRGITGDIRGGKNSLLDDQFPDLRGDFVIANPEFNQSGWGEDQIDPKDPRLKYGIPPDSNANFMWIQHFIYHLAPNGMAGFVMANGALAVGGREGEIRKRIIEDDLVDVIIACPPKLFYNVSLPVSLWFVTKNKKNGRFKNRVGETLFIDAREIFRPISRKQVEFTEDQIIYISSIAKLWRGENVIEETKDQLRELQEKYEKEIEELNSLLNSNLRNKEIKKKIEERVKELEELLKINLEIQKLWNENFGKGYKNIPGLCYSATIEEIRKNGYVLTPGRYVGVPQPPDDGVPFEEKMKKLTAELGEYFKQSRELEEKIRENLKKLNL